MSMGAVGMGAGVVGGAIESAAAGLERAAMRERLANAEASQRGYRDWAGGEFQRALGYWNPSQVQGDMAHAQQARLGSYNQLQRQPLTFAPSMGSSLTDRQDQAAIAEQAQRQAHLNSYADWLLGQTFKNMNTQRSLNRASSFASGTAALLPLQLYQSQHSYDWLSQLGQSISTLGGMQGQSQYGGAGVNQPPQMINMGGQQPAMWSGYGGLGNLPPAGTGYSAGFNQSTAPGSFSFY